MLLAIIVLSIASNDSVDYWMIWWETTWKMQTLEPLTCSHQVQIAFCSWGWWGWRGWRGRLVLPHHKQVRILAILVHLTIVWFDKPFPAEGEAKDEINSSSFVVIVPRCWSAGADQYLILRRSFQPYFFLTWVLPKWSDARSLPTGRADWYS